MGHWDFNLLVVSSPSFSLFSTEENVKIFPQLRDQVKSKTLTEHRYGSVKPVFLYFSGDGDSSFLCPFCPFDMFFATQQELSIHLKRAHSNEMDSLEAGPSTSDIVSSKRKKTKEMSLSLARKKSDTSGNTAVTNLLSRFEQVKNEHQRIAYDTNSLKGSLNGLSDAPNPVCMCSICPEHPTFLNEEDYFVHYKLFHEEPGEIFLVRH